MPREVKDLPSLPKLLHVGPYCYIGSYWDTEPVTGLSRQYLVTPTCPVAMRPRRDAALPVMLVMSVVDWGPFGALSFGMPWVPVAVL